MICPTCGKSLMNWYRLDDLLFLFQNHLEHKPVNLVHILTLLHYYCNAGCLNSNASCVQNQNGRFPGQTLKIGSSDSCFCLIPLFFPCINQVGILCNDCGAKGEVSFHIVAHKCLSCNSYNTKQTQGGHGASCLSDHVAEMVR